MPPIAGTLWHAAQLVALNAGPQPLLGGFDLREVLEAQPEFREFGRRDPGQRVARVHGPRLTAGDQRVAIAAAAQTPKPTRDRLECRHRLALLADGSRTISSPRMKLWPAPHMRVHSNA